MSVEEHAPSPRPGLFQGMLTVWRGGKFLFRHPRLLPFALIPILINIVLFAIGFYLSLSYFNRWLEALIPDGNAWYWIALVYLLTVLVVLVLLLIIVLSFTILANIIASPFNDALSARTESLALGREAGAPFSLVDILREMGRTVIEEFKKILFYLIAVGLLLFLNFIPVLGQALYGFLFTVLTIVWLGLSFLDYAMARHDYRFGGKLAFIRSNFLPVFGYGAGIFAGALIPIFNLAMIPMAVVGGTLLFLDLSSD